MEAAAGLHGPIALRTKLRFATKWAVAGDDCDAPRRDDPKSNAMTRISGPMQFAFLSQPGQRIFKVTSSMIPHERRSYQVAGMDARKGNRAPGDWGQIDLSFELSNRKPIAGMYRTLKFTFSMQYTCS